MTTDTVGGVWTFTIELARGLAAQGIEVVLAALGGQPSAAQDAEGRLIPGCCLLGSDYKLEWMENPGPDVEASRYWLKRLEEEYSPDLVHLNSFGQGALPWNAPVVLTAHSCVVSWWKAVLGIDPPESWNRYRAEVTDALNSADIVTAPSQAMARTLRENYWLEPSRCQVVPNGVCATGFISAAAKEPFVFAAGRLWDEAKNVSALARVAPDLAWPVYVAGESGDFKSCRALGRLSAAEIAVWYSRASIYALPARYEPFGLSALEAALSGCALVLGDIPSLREVWGNTACFVNPDHPSELRQAIDNLIADPNLRHQMASQAHRRALGYDSARMVGQYLEIYRSAIAKGNRQCVS